MSLMTDGQTLKDRRIIYIVKINNNNLPTESVDTVS